MLFELLMKIGGKENEIHLISSLFYIKRMLVFKLFLIYQLDLNHINFFIK